MGNENCSNKVKELAGNNKSVRDLASRFEHVNVNVAKVVDEGFDEVDCRIAPPANITSIPQSRDDSSEQFKASVSKELFTREYTQCNSIKFATTTGHESRLRTRTDNSDSVNSIRKDVN